jgi:hypothetical protein
MMDDYLDLTGKKFEFEDGALIEVIQVKHREDGLWVHYFISMNSNLPRKLVMKLEEFNNTFGHLFKE